MEPLASAMVVANSAIEPLRLPEGIVLVAVYVAYVTWVPVGTRSPPKKGIEDDDTVPEPVRVS